MRVDFAFEGLEVSEGLEARRKDAVPCVSHGRDEAGSPKTGGDSAGVEADRGEEIDIGGAGGTEASRASNLGGAARWAEIMESNWC